MDPAEPFLRAIWESPLDDAPRLVYADWLEETSDPDNVARAEFIRVQCELAGLENEPDRAKALAERAQSLFYGRSKKWRASLPTSYRQGDFYRGFVVPRVRMTAAKFLTFSDAAFRSSPQWDVELTEAAGRIAELAESPRLGHVRRLNLRNNGLTDDHLCQLAASPHLLGLEVLDAGYNQIGDDGILALVASPSLPRRAVLGLNSNRVGAAGALAILEAGFPTDTSPFTFRWPGYRLDLRQNSLGPAAVAELTRSPLLSRLTGLTLSYNGLGDEGARAIAACPHLTNLDSLDIASNEIGPEGAAALANSPFLANLRSLWIISNPIGDAGMIALAQSPYLKKLYSVDPSFTGVTQASMAARAQRWRV